MTHDTLVIRQRIFGWITLLHYLFSLILFSIPVTSRANTPQHKLMGDNAHRYVLYHKANDKSWQQIQRELAPQINDLPGWQKNLAQTYGLVLGEWLLLPDDNAATRRYPAVKLLFIGETEEPGDVAFKHHLSVEQLRNLNRDVKSPARLAELRGQWVIVPADRQIAGTTLPLAADDNALRDKMAALWGSAQHSGAGNALRDAASSSVDAALTQEVENWLNRTGGKARVTASAGLGKNASRDFGLDYLWPVAVWQNDILFTQMSAHRWNERNILNAGIGWRHTFNPHLMVGSNLFFDQDITRHHSRMGLGGEVWSDRIRGSVNYYLPVSDWRHSKDNTFNDSPVRYELYERAARGWDLNLEMAVSQHLSAKAGWFQWYGDKVDVTGSRSEASRNPYGMTLGMNWQPVPLVGINAEHRMISGQRDDSRVGLNFKWEFGRTLSQMLDASSASAMPSLMQSRTEFVARNNNIVLAYKQKEKDLRLYFDPTEKSVKAGVPFSHQVKGGRGGHVVYSSSDVAYASVDASGQVSPLRRGEVTITATEYAGIQSGTVQGSARYRLTIQPGDFAPSVSDVAINGSAQLNSELIGTYTYINNEGEDEEKAKTQLRWYHKESGEVVQEGAMTYRVRPTDMNKTLVFEVTPVNKHGVAGKPGMAEAAGPQAVLSDIYIDHLLAQGEIRPDGSIKFHNGVKGGMLLAAKVVDDKGQPLADQQVYWQSRNTLGALENNSVRSDANGVALVKISGIVADGQDEVIASLMPARTSRDAQASAERQRLNLRVLFARPEALTIKTQPAGDIEVASRHKFTVKASDQDGAPLTGSKLVWQSNGIVVENSTTDENGESTVEMEAPKSTAAEWKVSAELQGSRADAQPLHLVAGKVNSVQLEVPASAVAGSGNAAVSAVLKDQYDNPVASRNKAIVWKISNGHFVEGSDSGNSDAQGRVSAQVAIPDSAPQTITVGVGEQSKPLQIVVGDVHSVTLETDSKNVDADGETPVTLTAIALDKSGNPVANQAIEWDVSDSALVTEQHDATTNASGKAQLTLKAKTGLVTAKTLKVTATVNGHGDEQSINLAPLPVSQVALKADKESVAADASEAVTFTVTAQDKNGLATPGQTVSWMVSEPELVTETARVETTGADGKAKLTLKAKTGLVTAKTLKVTATVNGHGDEQSIDLAPLPTSQVALKADKESVAADASEAVTFTVTAQDKNGLATPGQTVRWMVSEPELVTETARVETTGADGKAKLTLKAKTGLVTAKTLKVTATVNGHGDEQSINLVPLPVSQLKLEADKHSVVADASEVVTLTATAQDTNGLAVPGLAVNWIIGEPDRVIEVARVETTDNSGKAQLKLKAKTGLVSVHELKVSVSAGELHQEETIIGQPLPVDSVQVTTENGTTIADGEKQVVFTVMAKDKNGIGLSGVDLDWKVETPELVSELYKAPQTNAQGAGQITLEVKKTGGTLKVSALAGGKSGSGQLLLSGIPVIESVTIPEKTSVGSQLKPEIKSHDNGSGPLTYTYQWMHQDGWITGATGETYTLQSSDIGKQVFVQVGVKNINGTNGQFVSSNKTAPVTGDVNSARLEPIILDKADPVIGESVTLTTKVKDSYGNPLSGLAVNFSSNYPAWMTITPENGGKTDAQGIAKASAKITAGKEYNAMGNYTLTATLANGQHAEKGVTYKADAASASLDPITVDNTNPNIGESVTLTTKVKDSYGNPLSGVVVSFSSNYPAWMTITPENGGKSDAQGIAKASAKITAGKEYNAMGNYTLTATLADGQHAEKGVTYKADAASARLDPVTVDNTNPNIGESVTLTTKVKDRYGNPLSGVAVSFSSNYPAWMTITPENGGKSDAQGIAKASAKITAGKEYNAMGDYALTAKLANGQRAEKGVSYQADKANAKVALVPDNTTPVAGKTVKLTATVTDPYGNLLEGVKVTFPNGYSSWVDITPAGNGNSNSKGVTTATVSIRADKGSDALGDYSFMAQLDNGAKGNTKVTYKKVTLPFTLNIHGADCTVWSYSKGTIRWDLPANAPADLKVDVYQWRNNKLKLDRTVNASDQVIYDLYTDKAAIISYAFVFRDKYGNKTKNGDEGGDLWSAAYVTYDSYGNRCTNEIYNSESAGYTWP
ncbi:Ig-like domain-containing protein [Enterobacteriaceae bacterium BIT-l23]|uniref:Ig-like domain-containing protein n=1 Tax=Jejubacter sp. L23 TaxID=3092086 RepID=UPI0015850F31|nr:Ig-like domain-containing protein [Enterobacteriaceae bacterium BIT-l23]